MSTSDFVRFLIELRDDPARLATYDERNLSQLLFHAKNEGYDCTAAEIEDVLGRLEVTLIMSKDQESIDGDSRLWREMWGHRRLSYIVQRVLARYSDDELARIGGLEGVEEGERV